jgi:pimeloyl-ACP methyl ester carboxylesterase
MILKSITISALYLIGLLYVAATSIVLAENRPDYAREARLADQIIDDIFDGEPVWLNANDHSFLAIHTLNEDQPKGTVVILHGRGYHPDWPEVAGPLRTGLVEAGWSTLSVQMPVLEKGSTYYDYLPLFKYSRGRIESAIAHIRETSNQPVILAAHSCGAHMANDWLYNGDDSRIDGYIIMGAGATDYRQVLRTPYPFANMRVPILDLYGELEYPRPLAMVPERKALLDTGGHPDSRQVVLPGADHYFHEAGDPLTEAVSLWLNATDFFRLP